MALLAAYSFDETGTTVADASGNGNTFSIASTGVTRTSSGHTNGGVTDSGSTVATLPNIGQTTNRTMMAWVKTSAAAPPDGWPLQWLVTSISSGSWGLLFLSGNAVVQARNSSASARAQTAWPTDGAWHHWAGTYDGSNVRIYLDGVLKATTALTGPLRTDANAPTLWGYTDTQIIDDLRIFDSAEDSNITTWMNTPVAAGNPQDTAIGTRTGAPVGSLAIDVPIATDVPGSARTGAPSSTVAIGVTVQDTPPGTRTGSPVDGPLVVGVAVQDVAGHAQAGAPAAHLAIDVILATDVPAGARTGAPVGGIGNTITNDVQVGTRTGAPASALSGAGSNAVTLSSLTGDLPNPNRPLLLVYADFTQGPPHGPSGGSARRSLNCNARRTIARKISTQTGRQYELDQVQSGTATLTVTDPMENLNPVNTGSPLNQSGQALKPYRPLRVTALWPNSGNMINPGMVGAGADPSFESGFCFFAPAGAGTTQAGSTSVFWDGARSMQVTQTTGGRGFGVSLALVVGPDLVMCMSAYVQPATGVTVQLRMIDAAGVEHVSNTASTPGVWTRIFVSWKAVDSVETVEIFGTGGATTQFYVDAVQLEYGLNPTAYTTSGPSPYRVYTGYIERYPLHYDMDGTRGIRPLTAVDALAVLSRTEINETYLKTILADGPNLVMPLADHSLPQQIQQPQGGAPLTGYTQLGSNSAAVNWAGDSFLDGSPAVTITQQNTSPPVFGDGNQITYLGTRGGSVSMNPTSFTIEAWVRFTSGCIYFGAAAMQLGEVLSGSSAATGPHKYIGWYTTGGSLTAIFRDPNGGQAGPVSIDIPTFPGGYPDNNWHYLAIVLNSGSWSMQVDAQYIPLGSLGFTPSQSIKLDNFFFDATTIYGDPVTAASFANVATYPVPLTQTQLTAHYQRGIGYLGEYSGARVGRLLAKYWAGAYAAAPGKLAMAADFDYNRRMVLDVLQEIQESERGLVYADTGGTVTFDDRDSRYRDVHQIPVCVFGENAAAGEIPYEEYEGDVDPTFTFSQANLTRPGNNNFAPMTNTATETDYGQRILSHNVQCTSDYDLTQAGEFYLARYGQAKLRIEKLTFNPVANPASWPALLGLKLGDRVTVKRRTAALSTSFDYYVEQINHDIDADAGTWRIDIQCSPVFVASAWVLGDATYGVLGSTTSPIY